AAGAWQPPQLAWAGGAPRPSSPPPMRGGPPQKGGGEGIFAPRKRPSPSPHPSPPWGEGAPPCQGTPFPCGEGSGVGVAVDCAPYARARPPPSLTLPHKGGGNREAVPGAMSSRTVMSQPSCDAAEDEGRVVRRIDVQAHAAPFEQQALAGGEVLDFAHRLPGLAHADVLVTEVQPELLRGVGERDRAGDRVVAADRLLQETDDIVVVDLQELQVAGLLKRAVVTTDLVQPADIILDVARRVPVARLDLVFLGVEIFLAPRDGLVLEQLEAVVDAVVRRQRRGKREARLEHPRLAGLQLHRQDVGRGHEEVRAEIFLIRIAGDLAEVGLQLLLRRAPREVSVGLREAEL